MRSSSLCWVAIPSRWARRFQVARCTAPPRSSEPAASLAFRTPIAIPFAAPLRPSCVGQYHRHPPSTAPFVPDRVTSLTSVSAVSDPSTRRSHQVRMLARPTAGVWSASTRRLTFRVAREEAPTAFPFATICTFVRWRAPRTPMMRRCAARCARWDIALACFLSIRSATFGMIRRSSIARSARAK